MAESRKRSFTSSLMKKRTLNDSPNLDALSTASKFKQKTTS